MTTTSYTSLREEWRHAWHNDRGFNPVTIFTMVAGFIVFWPVGLAVLARNIIRERQYRREHGEAMGCAGGWARGERRQGFYGSSGNSAFDDYRRARMEELEAMRRKLDEEHREFAGFMNELRRAKDREQFDRFMAERNAGKGTAV